MCSTSQMVKFDRVLQNTLYMLDEIAIIYSGFNLKTEQSTKYIAHPVHFQVNLSRSISYITFSKVYGNSISVAVIRETRSISSRPNILSLYLSSVSSHLVSCSRNLVFLCEHISLYMYTVWVDINAQERFMLH